MIRAMHVAPVQVDRNVLVIILIVKVVLKLAQNILWSA